MIKTSKKYYTKTNQFIAKFLQGSNFYANSYMYVDLGHKIIGFDNCYGEYYIPVTNIIMTEVLEAVKGSHIIIKFNDDLDKKESKLKEPYTNYYTVEEVTSF